jgi:hypothetical protein
MAWTGRGKHFDARSTMHGIDVRVPSPRGVLTGAFTGSSTGVPRCVTSGVEEK